ncbi:uncharacterized protein V1478_001613 [Vespula squamosa]|uniref:Uncharacterized protein n=1 Tax=Vespula squamosa TaxID=30214 RepID=A0ABD2C1Y0_VESSQ
MEQRAETDETSSIDKLTDLQQCQIFKHMQSDIKLKNTSKNTAKSLKGCISKIRRLRLCFNCLWDNHFVSRCKMGSCMAFVLTGTTFCIATCDDIMIGQQNAEIEYNSTKYCTTLSRSNKRSNNNVRTMNQSINRLILVFITLVNANGMPVSIRVLLDSGSKVIITTSSQIVHPMKRTITLKMFRR